MLAAQSSPLVLVGNSDCAISVSWGRLWTCSTAANRRLKPLPTSPACAWTPTLMNRRRAAGRSRTVGLRGKAHACRRRNHPSPHPGLSWAAAPVDFCDGTTRTVEVISPTAVWYRAGRPPVPLRRVLVRDPHGGFATQALLCTDPATDPTQILEWFVLRRQLEVTLQWVRAHLGVETQSQ